MSKEEIKELCRQLKAECREQNLPVVVMVLFPDTDQYNDVYCIASGDPVDLVAGIKEVSSKIVLDNLTTFYSSRR